MPSQLTQEVRGALSSFVSSRKEDGDHVAVDILRTVRDEAANMLERQMIWDTFDSDPFKLCEEDVAMRKQIRRAKSVMDVISCSRCSTKDGYASIDAAVSLKKDTMMRDVNDHLKLVFSYERMPLSLSDSGKGGFTTVCFDKTEDMSSARSTSDNKPEEMHNGKRKERPNVPRCKKRMNCSDKRRQRGTHVTYSIDLSKDHGMKERLLFVEVIAAGDGPSAKEALPFDDGTDGEWEDFDGVDSQGADVENMEESGDGGKELSDRTNTESSSGIGADGRDRYQAWADPDVFVKFMKWTKLELDESSSIFFFMTFPFYEHEWDLVGFVLDSVFGGGDDESSVASGSS